MDLFSDLPTEGAGNILPFDGTVLYYGKIMEEKQAARFYKVLWENIKWQNDEAIIFGKHFITKRKVAWYAATAFEYTYSRITKTAHIFTPELLQLKKMVEAITGFTYNACLLNLYHSGAEGMAWHSDAEKDLVKNGAIASLSLGAERKFSFKHKTTGSTINVNLSSGSLLVMKDETQTHWLHRLPPTKKVTEPRINLTFRTMLQ